MHTLKHNTIKTEGKEKSAQTRQVRSVNVGIIQMMQTVLSCGSFVYNYIQEFAGVRVYQLPYHVSDDSKITSIILEPMTIYMYSNESRVFHVMVYKPMVR